MTLTEALQKAPQMLLEKIKAAPGARDVIMLDNAPLGIIRTIEGKHRVVRLYAYENRAHRFQMTQEFKDFDTADEADELYLKILEMNGGLAFGDIVRISQGSGARFIQRNF